jgi:cytochrome c2
VISSSKRVFVVGSLAWFAAAAAADILSLSKGAYTAGQAERGITVYETHCLACHDVEFYRTKLAVWQSATVADFFGATSATMPSENPGALTDNEYLDVLAYIFSLTGAPSGDAELTLDNMASIEIDTGLELTTPAQLP